MFYFFTIKNDGPCIKFQCISDRPVCNWFVVVKIFKNYKKLVYDVEVKQWLFNGLKILKKSFIKITHITENGKVLIFIFKSRTSLHFYFDFYQLTN